MTESGFDRAGDVKLQLVSRQLRFNTNDTVESERLQFNRISWEMESSEKIFKIMHPDGSHLCHLCNNTGFIYGT